MSDVKLCKSCSLPASDVCAGCKAVYYCCRECQLAHWKEHKSYCKELKKSRSGAKDVLKAFNSSVGNAKRVSSSKTTVNEMADYSVRMNEASQTDDKTGAMMYFAKVWRTPDVHDLLVDIGMQEVTMKKNGFVGIIPLIIGLVKNGKLNESNLTLFFGDHTKVRGCIIEVESMQNSI
jgi:hypothetical protein